MLFKLAHFTIWTKEGKNLFIFSLGFFCYSLCEKFNWKFDRNWKTVSWYSYCRNSGTTHVTLFLYLLTFDFWINIHIDGKWNSTWRLSILLWINWFIYCNQHIAQFEINWNSVLYYYATHLQTTINTSMLLSNMIGQSSVDWLINMI